MKNNIIEEKRLPNGLVIRQEKQTDTYRRISVVLADPIEAHDYVVGTDESSKLVDLLVQKYAAFAKDELYSYGLLC